MGRRHLLLFFARSLSILKFKAHLAAFESEKGRKWLPFFGNEAREKIGLSRFNEFDDLLTGNFKLADRLAHPELAVPGIAATVGGSRIVNCSGFAHRAGSYGWEGGKIEFLLRTAGRISEVEGLFRISVELYCRGKWAPELASESFGTNRAFALPGLSVTVGEMVAALERVAGAEPAARILWERDPRITPIVLGWPAEVDTTRAESLGFARDSNFEDIVRRYVQEL